MSYIKENKYPVVLSRDEYMFMLRELKRYSGSSEANGTMFANAQKDKVRLRQKLDEAEKQNRELREALYLAYNGQLSEAWYRELVGIQSPRTGEPRKPHRPITPERLPAIPSRFFPII